MKGAHRDVHAVLQAIEGRTTEISQGELNNNFGLMIDLDCGQLSAAIFHMLNGLLTGEAHKELSDHESAQGLEVWRSITVSLSDKGPHKRTALLDRINCPPRAKNMQAMRGTLK